RHGAGTASAVAFVTGFSPFNGYTFMKSGCNSEWRSIPTAGDLDSPRLQNDKEKEVEQMTKTYDNYIDGQWAAASTGETVPSVNPANKDELVGRVPSSSADDLNAAVAAAKKAQPAWRKLSGAARGDFLFRAADALERNL